MKKKVRSGQKALAEKLFFPFGPSVTARRGCHVEIEGGKHGKELLVSGARRILEAGDECVILSLEDQRLSVLGHGLCCLTYDGGIAAIAGNVTEIRFLDNEGKR